MLCAILKNYYLKVDIMKNILMIIPWKGLEMRII